MAAAKKSSSSTSRRKKSSGGSKSSGGKKSSGGSKRASSTAASKRSTSTAGKRAADQGDKSVEAFRDALERSVTLSRDRIQEVVDDAVKRGRMTRKDANELVANLVARGRKQTEDLLAELERTLAQARKEVEGRAKDVRVEVETRTTTARRRAKGAAGKAGRAARDAADEPLARADQLRRRAGVGSNFPITGYDELTATQVRSRLGELSKPELRKIRTREKNNKARKSVLDAINKQLV